MITYIKGRLIEKTPTKIVVESSGIGYEINISLNTFERILKNNENQAGCTVHFVNEKLDSGKIILRKSFKISKNETIKSLKIKTQKIEYKAFSEAITKLHIKN